MNTASDTLAAIFADGPPAATDDDLRATAQALRARLLQHTNLLGAGVAVLNAIHRAGGYHVFDPQHQERIFRAMQALENAVTEAINA